jgi:hypothetical protein
MVKEQESACNFMSAIQHVCSRLTLWLHEQESREERPGRTARQSASGADTASEIKNVGT